MFNSKIVDIFPLNLYDLYSLSRKNQQTNILQPPLCGTKCWGI